LCRHSQWGVNANHLLAVLGTYFAIISLVLLCSSWWVVLVFIAMYLAIIAPNVPGRVLATVALALAGLMLTTWLTPPMPWGVYLVIIVGCYFFQQAGHRVFTTESDMSAFQGKYPKNMRLFLLLSIYELPILVNYLCCSTTANQTPPLQN